MRIIAFICSQNLPCSVDDTHKMIKSCQICNECKPCFYSPETDKSSTTYAAIKFRFQGTSTIKFHYHSTTFLTIVVKYSHFLFAILCQDVKAFFIYKVLCPIFSIFGETAYTHSDWGVVKGVKKEKGVATSPTTPYNP